MGRIFVGVAWPYANGPFHIGHFAGAYLPGDSFARFQRLRGEEVLMVSGSDMHGTPILLRAEAEGVSPEAIATRFDRENREAFRRLGLSFDEFTHTHTPEHERTVQELFLGLLRNGHVRRHTEENAYCPEHGRFLPDRYLVGTCPHCGFESARGDECDQCGRVLEPRGLGSPRCRICGTPAEFRPSEHFYLELEQFADGLARFLAERPQLRPNVRGTAGNFLAAGLHPTPITRDLDWGVPIPLDGYDSKRFYVWFDAVIGYLSASRAWAAARGEPERWRRFWSVGEAVRQYYFIGKDNIFHHALVLPAILLGVGGYQLPYDVPANEWMQIEGRKISKSRAQDATVSMPWLLEHYPPDQIRFYAALLAPEHHDTEFDWDEFHRVGEEIRSNQYGNLAQRALVLARERLGGRVPPAPLPERLEEISARLRAAHEAITREYDSVRLKEALDLALGEVRAANRRFQEARPWAAAGPERDAAVYEAIWLLKAVTVWLAPVLPFSSEALARMLGQPHGPADGEWDGAIVPPVPGTPLGEVRPLFPRLPGGGRGAPVAPAVPAAPAAGLQAAWSPLSVRAAIVRRAAAHPNADKLLVLEVDAGEPAPRSVVAGIRAQYSPEELTGRHVALLANLQHRTIRQVPSQGMVLATESDGRIALLEPPDSAAPGSVVDGGASGPEAIEYSVFDARRLLVGRVTATAQGGRSRVDVGGRQVDVPGTWDPGSPVIVELPGEDSGDGRVLAFAPDGPVKPGPGVPIGSRVR